MSIFVSVGYLKVVEILICQFKADLKKQDRYCLVERKKRTIEEHNVVISPVVFVEQITLSLLLQRNQSLQGENMTPVTLEKNTLLFITDINLMMHLFISHDMTFHTKWINVLHTQQK